MRLLAGVALTLGFASPVFADLSSNPGGTTIVTGCITDQYGAPYYGQPVWWSVVVFLNSGYHNHDDGNRPNGSLSTTSNYTGGDGCASTTFYAPLIAGQYQVTATTNVGEDTASIFVILQSPYLQYLPTYSTYQIVGVQPQHPSNPYGSFHAVYEIQQIASQFNQTTGVVMGVNDMSLPWGGMFDLGPAYGGTWWHTPKHGEHMWGLNADIPYAYLGGYNQTFLSIATANGGAGGGPILPEPNHYHLRFAY